MVDSTYLLPSLGISVKGLEAEDIQHISKYDGKVKYCYPTPLLAEILAKAAKESLKRKLTVPPREACEGLKALLAGLAVSLEVPAVDSLMLAAELWMKGHRDIMDDMAYAHAVKSQAYFMTLDEAFKSFLSRKGYTLEVIVTHKDLEKLTLQANEN
ncbi:hypothetical protein KEJ27_10180 [Candidatus Bathyarchaeota archaeon]|nr:hypothetical protein [Candidatus Bathyarchaeota archaeon]